MKTLPEFYAIKRDESNPLWQDFAQWFNEQSENIWSGDWLYRGVEGSEYNCWDHLEHFDGPITIISLEDWDEAVFGSEPQTMEKETTEFDSNKPFEVSHDGENFIRGNFEFVAWHKNFPVIYCGTNGGYHQYGDIRNIPEEFNASMLEVGEWMETDAGKDGKVNLIRRLKGGFVDVQNPGGDFFFMDIAKQITGRRVNVKHIIEEI